MFGLFVGGSSVFASPQISPLDPDYQPKTIGGGTGKQAKKEMLPETTALSTTYTNVDGNDNGPLKMPHAKKKFSLMGGHDSTDDLVSTKVEKVKVPKENKAEKAKVKEAKVKEAKVKEAKAKDSKIKEAKIASTKDADGVVGGTRAASAKIGDGMANGTKKVGDGLTSGAKASGSFFMKGAKAIGSGFKGSDDKDKTASASSSKKAPVEKADKTEKKAEKVAEEKRQAEEPKKVAKKTDFDERDKAKNKNKEKAKLDQSDDKKKKGLLSPISNTFKDGLHAATDKLSLTKPESPEAITAKAEHSTKPPKSKVRADEPTYISHGKPVKKTKEVKQASGPGIVSKTLGKLPFVGGSKKNSGDVLQKVAKSDDDALVSDPPVKSAGRSEEETPLGPSL
jgi:hypothetical protein